uniref:Uncharacterized protein n=1 Tax=Panthera leo TaxID=9689 RepID=A0A8C8WXZ7_PANLE
MSGDRQRSDDEGCSTSHGGSDADQLEPAAVKPEEERKPSATQQKKYPKVSSKTTAKLSTSAERIQSEPGSEFFLDISFSSDDPFKSICCTRICTTSTIRESSAWASLKTPGVLL